ncbi:COX assembly mitochondrial protein homolog isoform X2 [Eptesicus fuscus]|nr:COX assembly mitochondrial protein homolog isoform X2 [Eptesicus fuscus]XP_054564120.1 COX assembly mitochondrial protein homolog isoform X2 [Eptesicus fuscus]XP_054564121.1 COX assembly mitochondrial protein homolog isoform X2 [Eptesicus fuscus]
MREKARERCSEQVQDFTKCCKESGILMVVKCRKENSALKECLTAYYTDPAFYEECKMEYLKEREEFRKTGIPTKKRLQKLPTSMRFCSLESAVFIGQNKFQHLTPIPLITDKPE